MRTTDRPSYVRTADWQARTEHWLPLTSWTASDQTWEEAPEAVTGLLGVEPQDRHDRLELLHLALLAVSLDHRRLETEFAARTPLDPHAAHVDPAELAHYQADLTLNSLGTEPRSERARRHPARETGEAGHPLVAAVAPLDVEHVLAGEYLHELPAPRWTPITM